MSSGFSELERMIVRRLDGELSEQESLELDKALLRDPEARRLEEDYSLIDTLARASLGTMVESDEKVASRRLGDSLVKRGFTIRRGWWTLAAGAAVAACLALIVPPPDFMNGGNRANVAERSSLPATRLPASPVGGGMRRPDADLMRNVSHVRPKVRRSTDRGVIGVVGDDGNLYWIQVDRTLTLKRPAAQVPLPDSLEEL